MKTSTTIVLVAAAFALSIASIAVITPKAVKAAVATLIRDQDQAARHPFTTQCTAGPSGSLEATCITPVIPAGQEVVIETVSFSATADGANTNLRTNLITAAGGTTFGIYSLNTVADSGDLQPTRALFQTIQPVRLYADPGTIIICDIFTKGPNPSSGLSGSCYISGYYVTLP